MSPASTTSIDGVGAFLPLTLKVTGRACLVVGGGSVAARKAGRLLEAGARVTVVAPSLGRELERLVAEPGTDLHWEARSFREQDPEGAFLLVAATDDAEVNRAAASAARLRGVLTNVVDDPEASDFLVPSVLERGALQIAVSTSGLAPALAAALRRQLEDSFAPDWAQAVEIVGEARRRLFAAPLDPGLRRRANQALAALDVTGLLAEGGVEAFRRALAGELASLGIETGDLGLRQV